MIYRNFSLLMSATFALVGVRQMRHDDFDLREAPVASKRMTGAYRVWSRI